MSGTVTFLDCASDGLHEPPLSNDSSLVVVVSHDRAFRKLLHVLLDEVGYAVFDGEEGSMTEAHIAKLHPVLVIIDVNVGHERFAWALLRAIKEDPATAGIPVVACAAASWLLEHDAVFYTHNGIPTWSEPFELTNLLHAIELARAE